MVQRTVILDDFDESKQAKTVRFGFAGREFEIDLSEEHFAKLQELLTPYIEHGRAVPPAAPARRGRPARSPRGRHDLPAIRRWARAQGMDVAARGRVSREILAAYDQAHPSRR